MISLQKSIALLSQKKEDDTRIYNKTMNELKEKKDFDLASLTTPKDSLLLSYYVKKDALEKRLRSQALQQLDEKFLDDITKKENIFENMFLGHFSFRPLRFRRQADRQTDRQTDI